MAAVLAATLLVGATVQSLVGLGLGLVAAPLAVLLAPQLMPDLLLCLGMVFPLMTLVREHHEIDWRGLAWSFPARIPGTALGVLLVAVFTTRALGVAVGLVVLLSVVLTARAVVVPINRGTLLTAGFVSGVTGTATSIGGPPVALLYQHRPPHQIRSTLAVFFVVGAGISLIALGLAGELELAAVKLAVVMLPMLLLGVLVGRVLIRVVPPQRIRTGVLLVSAGSALVVLVRSLF